MKALSLFIACIAITSGTVLATSYRPPKKKTIRSSNGNFILVVDPLTKEHSVFAAARPNKRLWFFTEPVWHHHYFVSDDGKHVCIVKWEWVKIENLKGDAISIWTEQGKESKISYRDFGKRRRKLLGELGPIGMFWRVWNDGVFLKDNIVTIESFIKGKKRVEIDLSTGKLK